MVYLFDGQKIIETRNGSGTLVQQFIHGTQYIDEPVMVRVKDKGDLYIHQDANWNVIGTTDLGRHLVERNVYSPYGELTVDQKTGFGDYDGDGDVDAADRNLIAGACAGANPSGPCRTLDLNSDGTVNASDTTLFDALPQGLHRTPGKLASAVQQPFAHQGLLFEPEIGSYQNRARQYDAANMRFSQRDPVGAQDSQNLYSRSGGSPLRFVDPSGQTFIVDSGNLMEPNPSAADIAFFLDALRAICPGCSITIDSDGTVRINSSPADEIGQRLADQINDPDKWVYLRRTIVPPSVTGGLGNVRYVNIYIYTYFMLGPPACIDCVPTSPDSDLVHELSHVYPYPVPSPGSPKDGPINEENRYRRSRGMPVRSGCDHNPPHSCCDHFFCCPNPP